MSAGSLIGFALVAALLSWSSSVVLAGVVTGYRRRLGAAGPQAERAATTLALALPPLLGVAITTVLALGKLWELAATGADHCGAHPHHLHLCLVHGGTWAQTTWAVVAIGALGAVTGARIASTAGRRVRAAGALRKLRRVAEPIGERGETLLVPSSLPFAFTGGVMRPRIYVSTVLWEHLSPREREAVLAHERAHVRRGDVWKRLLLELAGHLGDPFFTSRLRARWHAATEKICDGEAAGKLADPVPVAQALVRSARLGLARPAGAFSFSSHDAGIRERVEELLAGRPSQKVYFRPTVLGCAAVVMLLAAAIVFFHPLHHLLESILGHS